MPTTERTEKLREARDQLAPVLTLLDAYEEHHIAALVSTALDTLDLRLGNARPGCAPDPASSPDR